MPSIPNPYSEFFREPNLLIPGKKPVGAVKIDWSHKLTNGLKFYTHYRGNTLYPQDLVSGRFCELALNVPTWTVDKDGKAIFHSITGDGVKFTGFDLGGISTYTFLCAGVLTVYSSFGAIPWSNGSQYMQIVSDTSVNIGGASVDVGFNSDDGQFHQFAFCSGGNRREYFVDADSKGSQVANGTTVTSGDVYLGRHSSTNKWDWNGNLHGVYIWDRFLTLAELKSLNDDLYQFLIPA